MTGKTTNLILLGSLMGLLLGGLLGYVTPELSPTTTIVGQVIFSALKALIVALIVAAVALLALATRGESRKLSGAGSRPFLFAGLATFVALFIGLLILDILGVYAPLVNGSAIFSSMLATLLLGGLTASFMVATLATIPVGHSASDSSSRGQGRYDRYDRHQSRYGSGRSEHRDSHRDQSRSGERGHYQGRSERGSRDQHDRGRGYRRDRPGDRRHESERTSPFTVTSQSDSALGSENPVTESSVPAGEDKPQTERSAERSERGERRERGERGDRYGDSRGRRHGGPRGHGRDRDRGPRQHRERRDYSSSRPSEASSEQTEPEPVQTSFGNLGTEESTPDTHSETAPNQIPESPDFNRESESREEPAATGDSGLIEGAPVEFGRSRHHRNFERPHNESETTSPESPESGPSELSPAEEPVTTGPIEFGRSRRKRTR